MNDTFVNGQMSLETLWRLLERQRNSNVSMASVVGLDEAKILIDDRQHQGGSSRGGMTTIGNYKHAKHESAQKSTFSKHIFQMKTLFFQEMHL